MQNNGDICFKFIFLVLLQRAYCEYFILTTSISQMKIQVNYICLISLTLYRINIIKTINKIYVKHVMEVITIINSLALISSYDQPPCFYWTLSKTDLKCSAPNKNSGFQGKRFYFNTKIMYQRFLHDFLKCFLFSSCPKCYVLFSSSYQEEQRDYGQIYIKSQFQVVQNYGLHTNVKLVFLEKI